MAEIEILYKSCIKHTILWQTGLRLMLKTIQRFATVQNVHYQSQHTRWRKPQSVQTWQVDRIQSFKCTSSISSNCKKNVLIMPSFVAGNSQWHWQPNLPISVIDRPYSNAGLPYLEWQINENETLYATTMSELDHFSRRCTACLKALGQITTVKGRNNPEPSEVNCSVGSELSDVEGAWSEILGRTTCIHHQLTSLCCRHLVSMLNVWNRIISVL